LTHEYYDRDIEPLARDIMTFSIREFHMEKIALAPREKFVIPNTLDTDSDDCKGNPFIQGQGLSIRQQTSPNVKGAPLVI